MPRYKLTTLFTRREDSYKKGTEAIFNKMYPTVLAAIKEFVGPDLAERLEWHDAVQVEDVITIIAFVAAKVGEELIIGMGEKILVTEQNKDLMSSIIRIGVPVDLADKASKEEVMKFLREEEARRVEAVLGGHGEVDPEDLLNYAADPTEFDMDSLDKDQLEQLLMHESGNKGKVH